MRKRGVLVSCLPFALLAGLFLSGCHSTPDKAVSRHRRPGEPLHPPPVPAHIPLPREPQMGWPEAEITRKSGDIATPKNIFGVFERLDVGAAETLGIRVRWPRPIMGGHVAAVGDVDRVGERILPVLRFGLLRQVPGLDGDLQRVLAFIHGGARSAYG